MIYFDNETRQFSVALAAATVAAYPVALTANMIRDVKHHKINKSISKNEADNLGLTGGLRKQYIRQSTGNKNGNTIERTDLREKIGRLNPTRLQNKRDALELVRDQKKTPEEYRDDFKEKKSELKQDKKDKRYDRKHDRAERKLEKVERKQLSKG